MISNLDKLIEDYEAYLKNNSNNEIDDDNLNDDLDFVSDDSDFYLKIKEKFDL